ncbi:MAG: 4Fe-4S binding protein [Bacteroidetes bacterium]|nr:4Fe-4S binding protein [Bacteroidota bacterium]MBU1718799.1 4Fe-4S binding protein [Bacteroidota bacterium]
MERDILIIDEEKCNGCGLCVPNCHEGALQVIDGKVRLVSELMCDGLGACIGHCPEDAIRIERREAQPYDETRVMESMIRKGKSTVVAHLRHMLEHGEFEFLKQGLDYIKQHEAECDFTADDIKIAVHSKEGASCNSSHGGGCPGSKAVIFEPEVIKEVASDTGNQPSTLSHWPVQMHLINPSAQYYRNADVLIAADCVAFSMGNFHSQHLAGKSLAIACPKLDHGQDVYLQKLVAMIDEAKINTITVMIMEVPCCSGLLALVQKAIASATRKVPVKALVISIRGEVIAEEWV